MKGKSVFVVFSLVMVVILILSACARATPTPAPAPGVPAATPTPTPPPKVIKWRMPTSWPRGLPVLWDGADYFAKTVTEASGGRLEVEAFPAGALVGGLELFDATIKGTVEAGHGAAGYQEGKFPAAAFFSAIPFSYEPEGYLTWLFHGGGLELWQEMYKDQPVIAMPVGLISMEMGGWFSKPLKTVDDFKGLKIRFFGLGGRAVGKLGASVVLMAGGELYLAMQRGVIDATEFSMPAIDEGLKLQEVAKYYFYPGWHQAASTPELLINKAAWEALTPDLRAIVKMASRDAMMYMMTIGEFKSALALKRLKDAGVTLFTLPPEEFAKIRKASEEVMEEGARADPFFAKVLKSYRDFSALYQPWAEISQSIYKP